MLQAQRALPRLQLAPVHHRILGEMHKEVAVRERANSLIADEPYYLQDREVGITQIMRGSPYRRQQPLLLPGCAARPDQSL
jgi:hypothetical protein